MTSKKQQQQQIQQRRATTPPPPPPPISTGSPPPATSSPPSPGISSHVEDRPRSESVSTMTHPAVIDTSMNDRFIHEAGPPTAISILRTQPAFIGKLYKMLEDDTQDLICWSSNGDYFSVYNSALFSKQVLPQYFKHNNWQSFVRQLNMYGFSKINEMIHSNLTYDNQAWDFKHPHFKRGDFQSLILVKRKSVRPPSAPSMSGAANTAFSSSSSSYPTNMLLDHSGNNSGMDTGPSDNTPDQSSSSQMPYDFPADEETGVENRVMQLDEKVRHVSTNVANLTSEIHDIKSLIYKQQSIIHELSTLVRTYTADSTSTEIPSSSSAADDSSHRHNSLPSIHNLAGNLQAGSHHQHHHHHHRPVLSHHHQPLYHHSSLLQQLPRQPSCSPPLADQEQKRRSSHPSSDKSKRNSNPIYPLLNSMPDPMDEN